MANGKYKHVFDERYNTCQSKCRDRCRGEDVKQNKPECLKTQVYGSNTFKPVKSNSQGQLEVVTVAGSTTNVTAADLDIRNLNCDADTVGVCGLSVDDNTPEPIKTDQNRVVATISSASTHSQIGQLYSTIVRTNTEENVNLQVLFRNFSVQTMYLDQIFFTSTLTIPVATPQNYMTSVTITIIKNATVLAVGTPVTPTNLNAAFSDASTLSVSTDPNTVSGSPVFSIRPIGNYLSIDFDGRIVVPPHSNIIVQFNLDTLGNPPSPTNVDFWSTIVWYEL